MKYLGPEYDIHTSGVDLIFPHHENTIAISQAANGKAPAGFWVHNEMVMVNHEEVPSNSENEELTLRDILDQGYTGREIRYWLLSSHYRRPIDFSWEKLQTARNTIAHLDTFIQKLHFSRQGPDDPEMDQVIYDLRKKSVESMDDDFNVSAALAALFRFIRRVNIKMDRKGLSNEDKEKILKALETVNSVLGVMNLEVPDADRDLEALLEKREEARRNKDWETSDRLRLELKEMGIEVTDTKEGPVWRRIKA
jgi:cysteinyl-tRNA synthetase